VHAVASWWDGVELWLVGLPFGPQFAIVMVVVLPLCVLASRFLDRVVGAVAAELGGRFSRRGSDSDVE
jgi:hypothetical protein